MEPEHTEPDYYQIARDVYTLAPLTSNLPIITIPDGEFVPLRALCEVVGLNPSSYIGVFCQHFQGRDVLRRLPWDSPTGQRKEWCLLRDHMPYWVVHVPTNRVPADLRDTLFALQKQCAALLGHTYKLMIEDHHLAKQFIFQALNLCAEQEEIIQKYEQTASLLPTPEIQQAWAAYLAYGRGLAEELAAALRKWLETLMQGPIIDGLILNKENEVVGTTTFPLFPIRGKPDPAIPELLRKMSDWSKALRRR